MVNYIIGFGRGCGYSGRFSVEISELILFLWKWVISRVLKFGVLLVFMFWFCL